jgi:hypothetical protein
VLKYNGRQYSISCQLLQTKNGFSLLLIFALWALYSSCLTKQKDQKTGSGALKVDSSAIIIDSTKKDYYSRQGDTINLGSFSIAILRCEEDFKPKDIYNIPENTLKNVFVKFLYKNNSDNIISIQPLKWLLVDPSGQSYYPTNKISGRFVPLKQNIIQSKESIVGWLAFKTPYYRNDFDAILKSDIKNENVIIIRIGVLNSFRNSSHLKSENR